ncbi:MAG: MoaD/ThiS family protein [Bacteroidetes bacterium]|nr:MoaD/ThiS family protein [Bacteroidota bacterium]
MAVYKILAFGIAKDIFGGRAIEIALDERATIENLRSALEDKYSKLKQLSSYMIAVNDEYADAANIISTHDEIAIIPPVSGG